MKSWWSLPVPILSTLSRSWLRVLGWVVGRWGAEISALIQSEVCESLHSPLPALRIADVEM